MPRSKFSCLSDRHEAAADRRETQAASGRERGYFGCIRIPASSRIVAAFR